MEVDREGACGRGAEVEVRRSAMVVAPADCRWVSRRRALTPGVTPSCPVGPARSYPSSRTFRTGMRSGGRARETLFGSSATVTRRRKLASTRRETMSKITEPWARVASTRDARETGLPARKPRAAAWTTATAVAGSTTPEGGSVQAMGWGVPFLADLTCWIWYVT